MDFPLAVFIVGVLVVFGLACYSLGFRNGRIITLSELRTFYENEAKASKAPPVPPTAH